MENFNCSKKKWPPSIRILSCIGGQCIDNNCSTLLTNCDTIRIAMHCYPFASNGIVNNCIVCLLMMSMHAPSRSACFLLRWSTLELSVTHAWPTSLRVHGVCKWCACTLRLLACTIATAIRLLCVMCLLCLLWLGSLQHACMQSHASCNACVDRCRCIDRCHGNWLCMRRLKCEREYSDDKEQCDKHETETLRTSEWIGCWSSWRRFLLHWPEWRPSSLTCLVQSALLMHCFRRT